MTNEEAAKALGVTLRTVYSLRDHGLLAASWELSGGRMRWIYLEGDVLELAEKRRKGLA